jgi:maleate isomerase
VHDGDLRARLAGYLAQLDDRMSDFGSLSLSAIYVACTGCFYPLEPAHVRSIETALTERWGRPVVLPVSAIAEAVGAVGIDRLSLVSPYPAWLTEQATRFWHSMDIDVVETLQVGAGDPYAVTASELVACVHERRLSGAGILFTGTGMRTLEAMDRLSHHVEMPMFSSNWCSAWKLQRLLSSAGSPASEPSTDRGDRA